MSFCFFFFAYTFCECGFSEVHITVNSVSTVRLTLRLKNTSNNNILTLTNIYTLQSECSWT